MLMSGDLFLYHGFRKSEDVRIENANIPVSCRGEGAGGQSDGFYVWNNLEKAKEYLGGYKCDNPVICKIKVPEDEVKYPQWQIDYEALGNFTDTDYEKQKQMCTKLAKLFVKYKAELPASCNYKEDLKNLGENGFELLFANETKYGAVRILIEPNKSNSRLALYEGNLLYSGCEQALTDYMCTHSDGYLKEYNELLKEGLSCHNVAFKYVGSKELEVVDIYDGLGNKNTDLTKQFLPEKKQQTLLASMIFRNMHSRK